MYQTLIRSELQQALQVLQRFLADNSQIQAIQAAAILLATTFKAGGKVLACGNGGSHCDAMHFAEELTGRYRNSRPPYPAIAIADPSHLTCVANDFGFDKVFSRYLEAFGQSGDVLLAISTSGHSRNVIAAVETARDQNMQVILLSGNQGRSLAGKADVAICVDHTGYADRIQEMHIKIIHLLIHLIEREMLPSV
jgi:D-sedoheptulose 7-phosphate isomerase